MDSKHNSREMNSYWEIPCAEVFLKTGMHYKGVVNGPLENRGLSNFHFVLDWIALGSFLYVLSLILNP